MSTLDWVQVRTFDGGETNLLSDACLDRVHSAGIVLGDRSVLYKYTNPNLIAVVTEGTDYQKGIDFLFWTLLCEAKRINQLFYSILAVLVPFVNIYLLDTVTGSIKLSHTHKRVKAPVHVVLSENWIVVSAHAWSGGSEKERMSMIFLVYLLQSTLPSLWSGQFLVIRRSRSIQLFGIFVVRSHRTCDTIESVYFTLRCQRHSSDNHRERHHFPRYHQ